MTSNPAASNGVRKCSKAQPPQKAPCTMTMAVIYSSFTREAAKPPKASTTRQ